MSRSDWEDEEIHHSLATRKAITMLRNFLYKKEASMLKSWFKYFDTNMNGIIEKQEFVESMSRVSYPGNIGDFWSQLDVSATESISLREINEDLACVWHKFRKFCGITFGGPKDLLMRMADRTENLEDGETRKRSASLASRLAGSGTPHAGQPLVIDSMGFCRVQSVEC
eukprot:symbB.v1.2.034076.t1/scaffold4335.1/size42080/2